VEVGDSYGRGEEMKVGMSKLFLVIGTLLIGEASAQLVLTNDVQDHRLILEDWEDQDGVGQKGHRKAIEDILPTLSAEKSNSLQEKFDALGAPADSADLLSLYIEVCSARRAERMGPYLEQFKEVVYCAHETPGEVFRDIGRKPAGELKVLRMEGLFGRESRLFHSRECRTPDVSYDGKRILFSSRHGDLKGFRLFEMNLVDSSVRQITHGYNDIDFVADLEAIYLPNGNIMFTSSRMIQAVDCFGGVVYNLFLCDGDGKYIRRIGFDQSPTNYPQVLPSGEVVYARWDYNDKSHIYGHALFGMKPDGTAQQEYYNNNSWWPSMIAQARPIPGTRKIMAMIGGYHREQSGEIGIIDNSAGMENGAGLLLLAPERLPEDDTLEKWGSPISNYKWDPPEGFNPETFVKPGAWPLDKWGGEGDLYSFPYPFDEKTYLVSRNEKLYFMKSDGRREYLAGQCASPIPIAPRDKAPIPASTVDYRDSTGLFQVMDVYTSQSHIMEGVPRGSIKRLRVLALGYRAQQRLSQYSMRGPARIHDGGATVSDPTAKNSASWDMKIVVGETPVHEDGSASFIAPARMPLFFQLIDEEGRMVQTMRSWATLQPGEEFSCVGCHESKLETPPVTGTPTAMRGDPVFLDPFYGPIRGFSFSKEIQPILDAKCVECHNDQKPNGIDLRGVPDGDKVREWTLSYNNLVSKKGRYVDWCLGESSPEYQPPYRCGSSKSPLIDTLLAGHEGVEMTREEIDKFCAWIDMGIQWAGDYAEGMSEGNKAKWAEAVALHEAWKADERANIEAYVKDVAVDPGGVRTAPNRHMELSTIVRYSGGELRLDIYGVPHSNGKPASLELFNLRGALLTKQKVAATTGGRVSLIIPGGRTSARGNYLVRLQVDGRKYSSRFICMGD